MKTIKEIVKEQIIAIEDVRAAYYDTERKYLKLDSTNRKEIGQGLLDEMKDYFHQIKLNIIELAFLLGFSVKEQEADTIDTWEYIYNRISIRWANSQFSLHQSIHVDGNIIENSEYPFRPQD